MPNNIRFTLQNVDKSKQITKVKTVPSEKQLLETLAEIALLELLKTYTLGSKREPKRTSQNDV